MYQLKLKTLSNLTTENAIIHSNLRKYVKPNLVLQMCNFGKTKTSIHVFSDIHGPNFQKIHK